MESVKFINSFQDIQFKQEIDVEFKNYNANIEIWKIKSIFTKVDTYTTQLSPLKVISIAM